MGTYSSKDVTVEANQEGIPSQTGNEMKHDEPVYPTHLMVRSNLESCGHFFLATGN
jgi:hypothetical protein